MTFDEARKQISDLLESSGYHSEWNDVLEYQFPEAYWVENVQVFPNGAYIRIDWPSNTFTFNDVTLEFDLQMWSHTEAGSLEHGVCLSSGKGKFIYSNGKIVDIDDLEIDGLYSQSITEPKYNSGRSYCWNIAQVLTSLKGVYPYPNDRKLAEWAGVTLNTIKRWQNPKAHAGSDAVEQLMDSFNAQENIVDILL